MNELFKTHQEAMIRLALEARAARQKAVGNDRFIHKGFIVKTLRELRANRKMLVR